MNPSLIQAIRRELARQADPAKAGPMQAYMKSEMPYRGVQTPIRRKIQKDLFLRYPIDTHESWKGTIEALWDGARFREERYAAVSLSSSSLYDPYQAMKTLPLYEKLIVEGAWWDYVDSIASGSIRRILRRTPVGMKKRMRVWSCSRDLWKRRTAILCQIGEKGDTDLELLYDCIEVNLADREFFIRKAIGWALREYAWTDPREVKRYVRTHKDELSPLSRREALKNVS